MQLEQLKYNEMKKAKRSRSVSPPGFAERLEALRKQQRLSQTELGEKIGIHFTHISRYERGLTVPAADTLRRLADALGVSVDYLMNGTAQEAARAHFEDRELLLQFQEIEKLDDDDKQVVKKFLDAFLCKKKLQELAR